MEFRNFFKSIGDRLRAKKYLGILPGALPISNKHWGGSEYLTALEVSLYTNRAINKRADKVGEIQFQLKDKNDNEIDNDPVLELLKKPNKVFTGPQFWKLVQIYYDAVGEVFILKESRREIFEARQLTGLHLLVPTLVTPKFGPDGMPSVFEYRTSEKTIEYKPEQIIYLHNPDPKQPLRGQSILKAGINAITTETQISQYHARILENGGKVEGVFKFKTGPLTENQLETIKDKYQKEYGAAKKAGLPMFLGGDADYINTGLTPAEMAFLDAKKMTLEDICILTGVPKSILASTNEVKFDNADADRAIFLRETIKPLLQNLCTALDYELFPDDRNLTFVDPTPENVEEKRKVLETANTINALTTNEKRRELAKLGIEDLEDVEGGDDILVPFSLAPLGQEPEDPAGDEPGLTDEEKALMRSKLVKVIEHPLRDPDVRTLYWNMQIKRMDKREKNFKRAVNNYFTEQAGRIVEGLAPAKTRYFRKKNLMDELFQIELEVKLGKKLFIPMLTDLLKEAGVDAAEFVGSEGSFTLTDDIASWIENRADVFLRKINETTFAKLQEVFAESLAAEEGREALISRIQETYGGIKKSRAGLIARTEVHNATQYGTMQGYKQAGMPIKIWVAVRDGYTRDSHAAVDGEERPIDRPFSNGLMFPGDPKGPAEEVINCRCVI